MSSSAPVQSSIFTPYLSPSLSSHLSALPVTTPLDSLSRTPPTRLQNTALPNIGHIELVSSTQYLEPLLAPPGVLTTRGPQLLLCTEGSAVLASADGELKLDKGKSAFIPAGAPVTARGPAVLYRATTNLN